MSIEFGIFNSEGLLEGEFYVREEAEASLAKSYAEDDAHVGVVCPECRECELPGGEVSGCPECSEEEEGEEEG